MPQGEGVFPPGDGYQDAVLIGEHAVGIDEAGCLIGDPLQVVGLAQRQFVLPHVEDGLLAALATLHVGSGVHACEVHPPEMTATRRIRSPSLTISSSVISSPRRGGGGP